MSWWLIKRRDSFIFAFILRWMVVIFYPLKFPSSSSGMFALRFTKLDQDRLITGCSPYCCVTLSATVSWTGCTSPRAQQKTLLTVRRTVRKETASFLVLTGDRGLFTVSRNCVGRPLWIYDHVTGCWVSGFRSNWIPYCDGCWAALWWRVVRALHHWTSRKCLFMESVVTDSINKHFREGLPYVPEPYEV
jgi:hypothetical protein